MNAVQKFIARRVFGINLGFDSAVRSNAGDIPWVVNQDARQDLTQFTRDEIMRKQRYMERNDGVTREVAQSMKIYTVGDGITPQGQTLDNDWNKQAKQYFNDWAISPDVTGRFSLAEMQAMVSNALEYDGEIFVIKTQDEFGTPKIQLLESHRIGNISCNQDTEDGILYDEIGKPISYRIRLSDTEYTDAPANAVLHIFDPERPSQGRAVTRMQHSIRQQLDRKELCKIELDAAREDGKVIRTIQNEAGELVEGRDFDFNTYGDETVTNTDGTESIVQRVKQFKDNVGVYVAALAKDEKFQSYASTRPRANFAPYVEFLNRMALAGVMPYEFALDSSKVGGAGVRLIVAKSDRIFSWRQTLIINRFLKPIWGYVIADAILKELLALVDGWQRSTWVTPKRITVDAGRDAAQHRADIQAGLGSLDDHYEESGAEFEDESIRRADNIAFLMKLADERGIPFWTMYQSSDLQTAGTANPDSEPLEPTPQQQTKPQADDE